MTNYSNSPDAIETTVAAMLTIETLRAALATRGGVLLGGGHGDMPIKTCTPCVLELAAICKLHRVTDSPADCGYPDIRRINDAFHDDVRRTDALLPWLVAFNGYGDWPTARKVAWCKIVALRTVREILPLILRARWPAHADACAAAVDLKGAAAAAAARWDAAADAAARRAAAAAADADARWAAAAAARWAAAAAAAAADDAADDAAADAAAADAARHQILDLAVMIQIEAAREVCQ